MKLLGTFAATIVCAALILPRFVVAQTAPSIPPSITTPDKVETRLGTLDFKDGAPSKATLEKAYDYIEPESSSMQSLVLRQRSACSIASNSSTARAEICRAGCRAIGTRLVRLMWDRSIPVTAAAVPAA